MMRFDCRVAIKKEMESMGLIKGVKKNEMRLGVCSKSGDIIEPFLKPQWYADCKDLARRSCDAVRNKELLIIPDTHEKTWFDWLEKI
jgi:valyl-tRNA synthetase